MRALYVCLCGGLLTASWLTAAEPQPAPAYAFAEPGISPTGGEIAFASGGAIWSVSAAGGEAHLLVADGATDRRPLFSPNGQELAFVSTRTGGGDIYVLALATGQTRRVTADDGQEVLDSWSPDGQWIYYSTTGHDIAGMNDIYRVHPGGGTPMPVSEDRYVNEFEGASSPDGTRLAFAARGVASNMWWRLGSSHLDQSEIWTLDLKAPKATPTSYTRLSPMGARQEWPMWSPDGTALYYVSDRNGPQNIWLRPASADGSDRVVTHFTDGRVLWPSMTKDGRTIAFERNFQIWTLDTASGKTAAVPIVRRGSPVTPPPDHVRQTNRFQDLTLSPDGKKVAFVARGAIFAASTKDAGDATRVTSTEALESEPAWSPDSRHLAYVSARNGGAQIYLYDFGSNQESALTTGTATDLSPRFSPDGKSIAYIRDRHALHVLDLAARQDRELATGTFADTINTPEPVWSPDGQWIGLFVIGARAFTNVELVPVAGGTPRPVSFLADAFADSLAWSHDGTFLLFDSRQRTENGVLARVDLTLKAPRFREDLFRDLFTQPVAPPRPSATPPAEAPPAPPGVVFDGIRERLSLLPVGLDVGQVIISPDGKTACLVASAAGQANLYAYSLDDLATERPVARQLTTTTGGKADPQFTADGKEIYYLDAGRINIVNVDRREARPLNVTAEMTVDFAVERSTVFTQAWTLMRDNFYDAAYHGVDWAKSRLLYGGLVGNAATPDEMRRILQLMVGDLNASHMGVTGPGVPASVGRLGLHFDRAAYESAGKLVIDGLIPLGPAAVAGGVKFGDVLVAVDGQPTAATASAPPPNLDELLANTVDHRVVLSLAAAGGTMREVVVRPITQAAEKQLLYRAWVNANREYVLKVSGGRLGYVHMINMSAAALDQLYVDLDTDNQARDGVVIDIRNNSGGFVNAYALDVFTRQPYLRMSTRGMSEAPARSILGQRALELPTVLVTNQHSLSDAEDFTEGYRTLKLGPVVGEPTAGWIIYTWDVTLVDGTTFRLPRMRITAADLTDMEGHPRPVDVEVSRPIGETLKGTDAQLDAAVRTLLKILGKAE